MMVRKSKGITEKHIKVLEFVNNYQSEYGRPPSIREIGEKVKISSTSVVNYYLEQLEKNGYIERDNRVSRGMRLTEKVNEIMEVTSDMLHVPILGPIAAGPLMLVPEPGVNYMNDKEYDAVDIARSLLPSKEKGNDFYALEVKGDSMIDAMINDGDIVVMKPAVEAKNGEMVAVRVEDEYTLKYFFKEKNSYRLQPANPTMDPIILKKNAPIEINGKVVMVIRKMDRVS
ncbi:MAG TPA: transcriptional repressor LexA [Anaerolineales bacterium]|nr:transcriptional repressor LexA [Anaerolineales bacterium]